MRTGQTEGGVDLARLAGLKPAGVICEILKEDGTMARRDDLVEFGREHGLKIVTVAESSNIACATKRSSSGSPRRDSRPPSANLRASVYRNLVDQSEHLVLTMGEITPDEPVLVRAHREYLPGDVFGYTTRNTRGLLQAAMEQIAFDRQRRDSVSQARVRRDRRRYRHRPRTPPHSRRASTRLNAPEADFRDYGIGAQILREVGVRKMRLLTDQPPRLANLPGYGLEIVESAPLSVGEAVPGS